MTHDEAGERAERQAPRVIAVTFSALGWWWADPIAALGVACFAVREGREAWHGGLTAVSSAT